MRTAKATIKEFGGVDTELAMTIRATYEAGQEWASGAHASDSAEDESESSQSKHDDLLTTVEAAEELGCTANNVRDLIRWEKLDAIHRGPLLFIDRAELERFKERRNAA
jgi:excisionase family DNA binding protein